ncbi:neither inactivation nor afterpotential protein G-like isoform X1 [Macrobrachium nipponense]|uniref:neither inactivation nor afterpotential protein G-like isoform X1 n=1 Tax=Macrobrachium nipponense TaxID=159736 RepID=UPI0030C836E0
MATVQENWSLSRVVFIGVIVGGAAVIWQTYFTPSPGVIYKPDSVYDFIIAGGGTAGSVLAARLSEVEHFKVLLIEAGPEEPWLSTIPLAAPLLQRSRFDWAYLTAPQQKSSMALNNRQSAWPRGKVLGGSGSINYNIHMYGSPQDFETWEKEFGATGWGFSEMKKFANMAECWRLRPKLFKQDMCVADATEQQKSGGCNSTSDSESEGKHVRQRQDAVQCYDPPLRVTTANSTLSYVFLEAGKELGLPVGNLNDDIDYGLMAAQTNVYRGNRWSSVKGYLRPALGRPNLHVLVNAHATKVIWENRRAVGMEYVMYDVAHKVYARAEVILSAGAISTPTILMHSGIGSPEILEYFDIPLVKSLRGVGANLQDHLNLPLYIDIKSPISLTLNKLQHPNTAWNYFVHGTGDLTGAAIEGVGNMPIKKNIPEVGIILFNLGSVDKQLYSTISNMKMESFETQFPHMDNKSSEGFIFLTSCLHPKSRGNIRLVSSDPRHPPSIDPNYLDHPYDLGCMRDAFKFAMRLVRTKAFQGIGASMHLPKYEECTIKGGLDEEDDTIALYNEYVSCIVRMAAITGYHPLGTARIGRRDDYMAVVDPELRVHGVSRLRVADASAMPTQISGTPNSAIIVLAEKAAHMIKETWSDKQKLSEQRICSTSDTCEQEILGDLPGSAAPPSRHVTCGVTLTLLVLSLISSYKLE